jgi:O-antigen/teichoic acid export membrane protein
VQIIENTVFYITVIFLAMSNYGLLSFAYGVVLRSLVGLIAIYSISPWVPRVGINRLSVKHLLAYGVPFQSMSFMALFKDELVNLFLVKLIGFEALGFIGWAKKWAESSLRIIMDNISRVVFPLFSRIQNDPNQQRNVIQRILKYQSMIMIPASLGMMMLMPLIIDILPQYEKWRPALPIFYIFVASSLFSSYSTPFINFFNGIGKVRLSLGFMMLWTIFTWVLVVPLSKMYGVFGFPLTVLLLSMTFVLVVLKARSFVSFSFMDTVVRYLVSGVVMSVALFAVERFTYPLGIWGVPLIIIAGAGVYYCVLRIIFQEDLVIEAQKILKPIISQS